MDNVIAFITTLIPYLFLAISCGIVTHKVAGKKGYPGYFWTGFFLWAIGAIYVAALPLATSQFSADEQRLLDHYRSLNTAGKKEMFDTLRIH